MLCSPSYPHGRSVRRRATRIPTRPAHVVCMLFVYGLAPINIRRVKNMPVRPQFVVTVGLLPASNRRMTPRAPYAAAGLGNVALACAPPARQVRARRYAHAHVAQVRARPVYAHARVAPVRCCLSHVADGAAYAHADACKFGVVPIRVHFHAQRRPFA